MLSWQVRNSRHSRKNPRRSEVSEHGGNAADSPRPVDKVLHTCMLMAKNHSQEYQKLP